MVGNSKRVAVKICGAQANWTETDRNGSNGHFASSLGWGTGGLSARGGLARENENHYPTLSFLFYLNSLCVCFFFRARNSFIFSVYPFFSGDFRGSVGIKNPFFLCCEPARPLQRSLRPFRPEMPKKSRQCVPAPPAPEPRKVSKKSLEQSEKTLSTLFGDSPETFPRENCMGGFRKGFFK